MTLERRKLLLGTSWTLASTLAAIIAGTILNPVLVLYLGIDGFGKWASAIAFASLFGLAGDLGVASALTKLLAERGGANGDIKSLGCSALIFGVTAGIVAGIALFATSFLVALDASSAQFVALLRLQALAMPFALGSASLLGLLQGGRKFRTLSVYTMIISLANVVLMAAALSAGGGLVGAMATSVALGGAGFVLLCYGRRRDLHFAGAELVSDFRRLVPLGFQLTVTNALSTVLYQADLVLLAALVGDARIIGVYAIAIFSTRILWIIPSSISITTYPVVSEYAASENWGRVNRYVATALLASITIVGALSSAFLLFGRPLLRFFFGIDSVGAYDLAVLLLAGTASLGTLRSIAPALVSLGRPDVGLRISALGAGLLIVLTYTLTKAFGERGAATAVCLDFLVVSIVLVLCIERFVLRPIGGRLRSKRLGATAASATAAATVCALLALPPQPTLWTVAGAIALWTALTAATGLASGGRNTWRGIFRETRPLPEKIS